VSARRRWRMVLSWEKISLGERSSMMVAVNTDDGTIRIV
jgi:hypothetical protein